MSNQRALISAALLCTGMIIGYLVALEQQPEAPAGAASAPTPAMKTVKDSTTHPSAPSRPAAVSPPAAASLAEIADIKGDFDQTLALYQLIAQDDEAALLNRLATMPQRLSRQDRAAAASIILSRLTELSPEAALAYVVDRPDLAQERWLRTVFFAWSKTDLDAALLALEALPGTLRRMAAGAVLQARDDLPSQQRRDLAQRLGLSRVPIVRSGDFGEGWSQALQLADPRARLEQQQQVLGAWAAADPEGAWGAVESLSEGAQKQLLQQQVLGRWAELAPEQVLELLQNDPSIPRRDRYIGIALAALAKQDVAGALARFDALPASLQPQARRALIEPLAQSDPDRLKAWLQSSTDQNFDLRAYATLLRSLTESGNVADLSWIDELPEDKARLAEQFAIQSLVAVAPEQAVTRIEALPPGGRRNQAVSALATRWVREEPERAMAWLEGLPPAERQEALPAVFASWSTIDFEAAAGARSSLPSSDVRDRVTLGMVLQAPDARAIDRLLLDIRDESSRRAALMSVFPRLETMNPGLADRYRAEYDAAVQARAGRSAPQGAIPFSQ